MSAPTFVAEQFDTWNTTRDTKTSGAFNVSTGDVIVAFAQDDDNLADLVVSWTGTGTWTRQQLVQVSAFAALSVWTVVAGASASVTVQATNAFGLAVLQFSGSDGVGNSSKTNVASGAPTLNLTTTQINSAVVVANIDWVAGSGASRTWRANFGPLTETTFVETGGATVYGGYHANAGAVGTQAVGLSAPGSQKYSIVAVEIKGLASGAQPITFVQSSGVTIGTAASTWSIPIGASSMVGGGLMVIGVGVGTSGVTVSTITDNTTNVYLKAVARGSPRPTAGAELWYANGFSTASTRVSVTLSGNDSGALAYGEFVGISTGTPLGPTGSSAITANSTSHSVSEITPTSSNVVISFARLTASTIGTITNNANYNTWISTNTIARTFGAYWIQSTASTATGPFTTSSNCQHAAVIAAFYDTVVVGGAAFVWSPSFCLFGVS